MCDEVTTLICEATEHHKLIDLDNVSYFNYVDESDANMRGIDVDSCKQAFMKNCTCKAGMYKYLNNMTWRLFPTYSDIFTSKGQHLLAHLYFSKCNYPLLKNRMHTPGSITRM